MAGSKDTQEEKSQVGSVEERYRTTDPPQCLNLAVLREKKRHRRDKDPKENVVLSCMKMPKDEGSGEEPSCPRYLCTSEPALMDCSAINSIQSYHLIQCPKEGQAGEGTWEEKPQPRSRICRAKSDENHGNIDLCCPPEVLEDEEPRVKRRTIRSSQERHNLAYPPPTHTSLFLHTDPDYQCPRLGQESSQGWVIAVGVLGILVVLVILGVTLWRGRGGQRGWRKERHSSKKPLKVEEGLGKGQDGDGNGETPGR